MAALLTAYPIDLGALRFNNRDDAGVEMFASLDGWGGAGVTLAPKQNPGGNGTWSGDNYLTGREITLNGSIVSPNPATHEDAIDALLGACSLDETKLAVTDARRTRWAMVRCSDEPIVNYETDTYTSFTLGFHADDARKFADPISITTGLPSSTGGLKWPHGWPVKWSGVTVSGVAHLNNPGNITGPIMIRIDGPSPPPVITHLGTGAQLIFSSSLSLQAGEFLTIDMERQEVLANGQSTRSGFVVDRGFFGFDVGPNDIVFGTSGAFDAAARMTVTAWPSWR